MKKFTQFKTKSILQLGVIGICLSLGFGFSSLKAESNGESILMASLESEANNPEIPISHERHGGEEGHFAMENFSSAIKNLWPENQCSHEIHYKLNYTLVSVACTGDYTKVLRDDLFDVFFKNQYYMIKETYQLEQKSGMYLYKLEDKNNQGELVFVKLFFRNSSLLWPRNQDRTPRVAVFVANVTEMNDLIKWQGLGIPLTYGVIPQPSSNEIASKVKAYGEGLWVTLHLESDNQLENSEKTITMETGLHEEQLTTKIGAIIPPEWSVSGVCVTGGTQFLTDVGATRNLIRSIRAKNIDGFLDTSSVKNSVGYETARIMSMKSFQSTSNIYKGESYFVKKWNYVLATALEKRQAILVVDAKNEASRNFLKKVIQKHRGRIDFVQMNQMQEFSEKSTTIK